MTAEPVLGADYQEWPFQGYLKRVRIGNEIKYNLEFKLPYIPERLDLPISETSFSMDSTQAVPTQAVQAQAVPTQAVPAQAVPAQAVPNQEVPMQEMPGTPATPGEPKVQYPPWTPEEDQTVIAMKSEGCSWDEIHAILSHRTKLSIQVRWSRKLKAQLGS